MMMVSKQGWSYLENFVYLPNTSAAATIGSGDTQSIVLGLLI
jgi:hypothetical protein